MKFLHISDLHIGKRVNEFSMIEDQRHILGQILQIAKTEQADAVLIAGDIYDKPVPSAEAVQMFDWFLTGLADQGRAVFAVSGNHDSPERIAFGAQLMRGRGVYVSPVYEGETARIGLTDAWGELCVWLLPFVKPATVRHALEGKLEGEPPESYQEAVKIAVDRMEIDENKRNIRVAHQFVTGAGRCDSEEAVVGGLDNVDAEVFDRFDYVALGHIHSPQSVGRETVRYCGTPLKYSFSEAGKVRHFGGNAGKRPGAPFRSAPGALARHAENQRALSGSDVQDFLPGHGSGGLCADHADGRRGHPGRPAETAHGVSEPDAPELRQQPHETGQGSGVGGGDRAEVGDPAVRRVL